MQNKKALLIIDIQNDYFEGGAFPLVNTETAALKAKQLLEKFRKNKQTIVHIQHVASDSNAGFFRSNTKGVEINEAVKPQPKEKVIVKHYPNSFRETELLDYLKTLGVEQLVVCGMMTNMCVDATVRAAKDFGFSCIVVGDACAATSLEYDGQLLKGNDVHATFLAALSYFYADVVTTTTYLSEIE